MNIKRNNKLLNFNYITLQLIVVFLVHVVNSQQAAIAGVSISHYFTGIQSFRVAFTQKVIELNTNDEKVTEGYLVVKNPDKFYLEYTKPYKLLYIADGKKLWSYDEDLEQVIVKLQSNILIDTPAMILSRPQDIDKKYNVTELATIKNIKRYKLQPKLKNTAFEAVVLGFVNGQLKSMEMFDNFGQHTLLQFKSIEKNPKLKPDFFTFEPPKGVDVISDDINS